MKRHQEIVKEGSPFGDYCSFPLIIGVVRRNVSGYRPPIVGADVFQFVEVE